MGENVDISRRKFLLGGASAILGGVIAGGIAGSIIKPGTAHAAMPGYFPIPSNPLDVNLVRKFAFHHYFQSNGCMNAAASSLIEAIKYALGADPYTYPPVTTGTDWDIVPTGMTSWYKYGSGGVSSWGTLCGALNGSIAVLNLINKQALAEQILYYYCQTEFPLKGLHDLMSDPVYGWGTNFAPEPVPDNEVLAYTTSDSPLCHISVSKWANAAGISMTESTLYGTAHKTDRCAKVSADIAAFTARLLNGETSALEMPADTAACYACHQTSTVPAQQGKMDCSHCHTQEAVIVGRRHPGGGGMGGM